MIIFAEPPKPNSYKLLLLLMVIDTAMASCTHKDNSSCATCVDDFNCYWCEQTRHCGDKTIGRHFLGKIRKECGGGEWFSYKQCKINGKYMSHIIYASAVVGVVLLVVVLGTICFRAYKKRDYDMGDAVAAYNARTPLL